MASTMGNEDLAQYMKPFRVAVMENGSATEQLLEVHPLALMIPGMNPEDDSMLRADVRKNGVREPLVILDGKVLDGRNRLRIASQEGATVRLEEFRGNEEAARSYVWSVNVARRHLTVPQLAMLAERFGFIREARQVNEDRWPATVSKQIGGAVSPETLKRFGDGRVADAPVTVARIDAGKVRRMDVAVKSAAAELGIKVPPPVARTSWDRLGCARGDVLAAERAVMSGEFLDPIAFAGRAREIQAALVRIDQVMRGRVAS